LGYGNGYGSQNGVEQVLPFNENFTAGGADTLRGFENNTVGPRGVQIFAGQPILGPDGEVVPGSVGSSFISLSQRSLGGNAMALGGVELIVPTPFVSAELDNTVRTSVFVDVGNVWDTEFDFTELSRLDNRSQDPLLDYSDFTLYRASAGISVQWLSAFGPLQFSLSSALKDRPGDDARFFTFNIGQTF
jgi:outer membrane protein insertion porin family